MQTSLNPSAPMRKSLAAILVSAFLLLPVTTAEAQVMDRAQYGPQVGAQFSPDAFTIGAAIIFYQLIESLPELGIGGDFHYGFGSEGSFDFSTITIGILAYYAFLVATNAYLMPLAGLQFYRFNYSDCDNIFGISCDFTDTALALGAALLYQQFLFRAILGLGGANDFGLTVGYMFGNGRPAASQM